MQVYTVHDSRFLKYGKILHGFCSDECLSVLDSFEIPSGGVKYAQSSPALETLSFCHDLKKAVFGTMDIQSGYCCGHKSRLNALEYHRTSEVNLMATDAIFLFGTREKLSDNFQYHSDNIEGFFIPRGTCLELYSNTLHYSPFDVNGQGFCYMVILPRGTNTPLAAPSGNTGEEALLTENNKWLLGYPDAGLAESVFIGLHGVNFSIDDIEPGPIR